MDLEDARIRCWEYLDSINASTRLDSPGVLVTRAVICVLDPSPEHDEFSEDAVEWFFILLNKLGKQPQQIQSLFATFR